MKEKNCRECGAKFTIEDKQLKFYEKAGFAEPERCPDCRRLKRQKEAMSCNDCGELFEMNGLEIQYYERNNLKLPKRCPACRRKRRESNGK
jgi:predicted RNA-binding Zn-ribbon protein involved in translation (DUF1610 family)